MPARRHKRTDRWHGARHSTCVLFVLNVFLLQRSKRLSRFVVFGPARICTIAFRLSVLAAHGERSKAPLSRLFHFAVVVPARDRISWCPAPSTADNWREHMSSTFHSDTPGGVGVNGLKMYWSPVRGFAITEYRFKPFKCTSVKR